MVTSVRTRSEYSARRQSTLGPVNPGLLNAMLRAMTPEKIAALREAVGEQSLRDSLALSHKREEGVS